MGRVHGWLLIGAVGAGAAPAAADDYQIHFVATGSAAATDNVFSAPDGGMVGRAADVAYTLTPGLVASYGTPRTTQELAFNASLNGYVDHGEAWGLQLFGDYRAAISLTPLTELALSAGLSRGTTNALGTQTAASEGTAAPSQSGQINSISTRADEVVAHSLSADTRLQQTGGTSYTVVTDAADHDVGTFSVTAGVGADHGFQVSSAGIDAGVTYLSFDRGATMTMTAEPDRRADARLGLRWRRDVSQRWSVGADGGVVTVIPIDGNAGWTPVPVVSANVAYVPEWGTANLQIGRAVTANPFIAQETVSESAGLSVNLPLPWLNSGRPSDNPEWTASGALAGARSRIINADTGKLTGSIVNGLFDVALSYVPREEMTFSWRFQYTRQKTLDAPVGMDGVAELPSFSRSTLLFNFTYRYPGRIITRLPPRELLRVDQEPSSAPMIERRGERRN